VAGKPHKPASQLQSHREARAERRSLRVVDPGERKRSAPRVPQDLGALGRMMWRAIWHSDISLAISPAAIYDLHRFCRLLDRREAIEAQIYCETVAEQQRGLLVEGSMGQPVANPNLTIVKELSREIEKTREQFGIPPLAQMRLGVTKVTQDNGMADLRRKMRDLPSGERDEPAGVINLDELG
jgi:P27 family predicted phage terminase small subunit